MTNKEMAAILNKELNQVEAKEKFHNQIDIISSADTFTANLIVLQSKGFDHLVNMLCVDWIDDNKFQVSYNIWSYSLKIQLNVKVYIDRDKAELPTIMKLWP
jgi:NADH-quinone oxidoreductase subunit C